MKRFFLLSLGCFAIAILLLIGRASDASPARAALHPQSALGATPTPTDCPLTYTYTVSTGTVVTSTNLVPGSQCGGCVVPIGLPFPFTYYGQIYTSANASTLGNLQFVTANYTYQSCPFPYAQLGPAMMPYWSNVLDTSWSDPCLANYNAPCGIFTTLTGTAPNRTFKVEWRARWGGSNHETVDMEIRLHENSEAFEFASGGGIMFGDYTTVGVQDGASGFTSYVCDQPDALYNKTISWTPQYPPSCAPTQTATRVATATPTVPTATSTRPSTPTYTAFCQMVIHGSITSSDPVQTGILNFVHTPSDCSSPTRACPGVADTTPRHYKAYTFYNPVGSFSTQCINIRIDTTSCSGNIHSASYVASFSQSDICSNYLGDTGDVVVGSGSYEFNIFRGRYVVVVVTEVTPGSGCSDFTVTITPQNTCLSTPTSTPRTATRTATSTPTPTNGTATRTPTGILTEITATGTPPGVTSTPTITTTSTACPVTFTDVPPGSTFYPYVRCLACRGIVSGYTDGTYRPNNSVTRGQAAKIISGAAGYSDPIPPDQQTFNDVPPGSTFWLYVERVALHGAISGYPCGTNPGEPCPGVYFRPQNTLTRGQAAKVVSIAAGYSDPIPPGQQTFNDVLPGSTFWLYIERAASHGVVNGYPDGTYRPQNNVTRGQLVKIAANAFFPDCEP